MDNPMSMVWSALRRRRLLATTLFAATLAAVLGLVYAMPDMYRSAATVMINPSAVPENVVRGAALTEIEPRLYAVTQEVLGERSGELREAYTRFLEDEKVPCLRKPFGVDAGARFDAQPWDSFRGDVVTLSQRLAGLLREDRRVVASGDGVGAANRLVDVLGRRDHASQWCGISPGPGIELIGFDPVGQGIEVVGVDVVRDSHGGSPQELGPGGHRVEHDRLVTPGRRGRPRRVGRSCHRRPRS
jgi:hypothetical protein